MTWFLEALKIKEEEIGIEWSCDVRFIIYSYGDERQQLIQMEK